jgi:hypothetical protein
MLNLRSELSTAFKGRGIDSVPRKGSAGQVPEFSTLPKPLIVRTLQDGFNINNVSDINLVSRRKSKPDYDVMRQTSAGSLSPERRGVDFPAAVRQVSIEHASPKRHLTPRAKPEPQNLIVRTLSAVSDAERIGRRVRGRSRSPEENQPMSPKPPLPDWPGRKMRSRSPSFAKLSNIRPLQIEAVAPICSWGESLAFENVDDFAGELSCSNSVPNLSSDGGDISPVVVEGACDPQNWQALKYSPSFHSDDGRSTTIGSGSTGLRSRTSSAYFTDTIRSDGTNLSTTLAITTAANNVVEFSQHVDKRFARAYEKRLQAMVKSEQKKALRKATNDRLQWKSTVY